MAAALLLVLLAAEGLTILRVHSLLTPHVVIGMVLVPVVLVKIGSTSWRFARYYLGDPEYRRKGPPPLLLRLLGPFVVVLTVAVLGTGVALIFSPTTGRSQWLFLHKATFVLWLGAMTLHVLGHLLDTARLAPRDFYRRTRAQVHGASVRQWLIVGAVAIGALLALAVAPKIGPWRAAGSGSPVGVAQHDSRGTPSILAHCREQSLIERPGAHSDRRRALTTVLLVCFGLILSACSNGTPARGAAHAAASGGSGTGSRRPPTTTSTAPATTSSTLTGPEGAGPFAHPGDVAPVGHPRPWAKAPGRLRAAQSAAARPSTRRRWCLPAVRNRPGSPGWTPACSRQSCTRVPRARVGVRTSSPHRSNPRRLRHWSLLSMAAS